MARGIPEIGGAADCRRNRSGPQRDQSASLPNRRQRRDPHAATARNTARLIPNSELHEDVVEKRSDDNLLKEWNRKEWRDAEPRMAAILSAFLEKHERAIATV